MSTLPYVRYAQFKSFAKRLSKRFAVQLSQAQEMLSRASGYRDLHQLQTMRPDPLVKEGGDAPRIAIEVWMRRMQGAFGDDLNALFTEDELVNWCRRIHGRLEGDVEVEDMPLSDTEVDVRDDS